MELTVKEKVYEIIARKLKKQVSDLKDEINPKKDLGADSIDTVEIVFEVEEFYKISATMNTLRQFTIGDAVKVVEELASK